MQLMLSIASQLFVFLVFAMINEESNKNGKKERKKKYIEAVVAHRRPIHIDYLF